MNLESCLTVHNLNIPISIQVFLAKNKQEDQFYAIKVLNKAAIRKRNEVCETVKCGIR